MQQDGAATITHHFNLGLGYRILMMGAAPTMGECLPTLDTIAFKIIVIKAEVVCVVGLNFDAVGYSDSFIGLF